MTLKLHFEVGAPPSKAKCKSVGYSIGLMQKHESDFSITAGLVQYNLPRDEM